MIINVKRNSYADVRQLARIFWGKSKYESDQDMVITSLIKFFLQKVLHVGELRW